MKRIRTAFPGVVGYRSRRGELAYYIIYRTADGRQREEKAGRKAAGMTPARAALLRAERMAAGDGGTPPGAWTLARLFERYQRTLPPGRGRDTDRTCFRRLGGMRARTFAELATPDVEALRRRLERGLAPVSVRATLALLERLRNYGVRAGLIPEPDRRRLHIGKPRADCQRTEVLSDEAQARLVRVLRADLPAHPGAAYMLLILLTGIRRTAAVNLRWDDVDEGLARLRLRGATAKNRRTAYIPLSAEALGVLSHLPRSGPWLFPSPRDPARPRPNFNRYVARVRERARLPHGFRPLHGLRHNFASRLASSGLVDIYTLQKLLTHASPAMTQRYAHLADAALRRAGNACPAIILGRQVESEREA